MTSTLIDTNTLLDIIEARAGWEEWASRRVFEARLQGAVVLNPVVYAEASLPYESEVQFNEIIDGAGFKKEDLPWEAAFLAGKAHLKYLQRGGVRHQTLPDFFVAAHALVKNYKLVTRDATRFRSYFPSLEIIAPDTHP